MTEHNNQWNIRLRQLRDGFSHFVRKTKQLLLVFWHNLPIYWHKLKVNSVSLYRSSRSGAVKSWEKLKSGWQGKKYRVRKTTDTQGGLADPDEAGAGDEFALQTKSNAHALVKIPRRRKKTPPIRRTGRQRVYRLKGYTTVAKVNRKHNAELQQQLLRKLLLFVGLILLLIILFYLFNPVRDLSELYRIIGISDIADLTENNPLFPDISPTPRP